MNKLDEKDIQLLKSLQKDAKQTIKELAQEINLSPSPVFERVRRLENEGYIKQYTIALDVDKLHRAFTVFCQVKLKKHDRNIGNEFVQAVLKIDEITECYNISGDFDFLLKVQVRDMKHYQDFVFNTLGSLDCLGGTHSTFAMAEIKYDPGSILEQYSN